MGCTGPLHGWMSREKTPLGKRRLSFSIREAYHDLPLTVPCGTCPGCKLDHARAWAVRCTHEAQMWKDNCFVTLTYRQLPPHGSLRPADFTNFMKKLRNYFLTTDPPRRIRYLQAGEYGKLGRPHHHAILFNCDFDDKSPLKETSPGNIIYRSPTLETLWTHGFSSIGTVTPQSAAYVARYTLKKQHHQKDSLKHPEYITMSRRPGIGLRWIEKYASDVYPGDEVITRDGKKTRPPRYYDEWLRTQNPELLNQLKRRRIEEVNREETNSTRMLSKRINLERRINDHLKRNL